jgi:hypothetical protein
MTEFFCFQVPNKEKLFKSALALSMYPSEEIFDNLASNEKPLPMFPVPSLRFLFQELKEPKDCCEEA